METPTPRQGHWTTGLDLPSAGRAMAAIDEEVPPDLNVEDLPQVEGYIIDRRLGGGAGGNVYRALRTGSDQYVALKILNQRLGESPGARRAWRELDVLAQLRLSSIPRLLDHGEHDGRLYLVTEFVDGLPLLEFSHQEHLTLRAKVELMARIADIVLELHEYAVIHRDIKPDNILINARGQPVLIDLGIATLLSHDVVETLTRDGAPIGTPAYMSPEQARGEAQAISIRSDIYGLGATAYMLLTDHTPHAMDVTIHEAIRRVAHDPPREPRDLEPSLPKPLAAILRKAVAVHPEKRYESAGAMAVDLRRWLKGEHVDAGGVTVAQRVGRFIARHPIASTVAACAIVAALSLSMNAFSVWWLNMRPNALEIDPVNRAWVRLVSHSGRELYRWDAGEIISATLVDRPKELGGGGVVLIRFGESPDAGLAGQLCAYDVYDPGTLLWATGIGHLAFTMPTPISMNRGDTFRAWRMDVQDVFPESPGREIIAAHRLNVFSATCIRVYALDGRILYEVWHDGVPDDMYWMSEAGLLIFCGFNSEGLWSERGYVGGTMTTRPVVIVALRPEHGMRYHEWIRTPGGAGTVDPVWYSCLFPPELAEQLWWAGHRMELRTPTHESGRRDLVAWTFTLAHDGALLYLVVDREGRIVDRFTSDSYRAGGGALPDPAVFSLRQLPPLIQGGGESAPEAAGR